MSFPLEDQHHRWRWWRRMEQRWADQPRSSCWQFSVICRGGTCQGRDTSSDEEVPDSDPPDPVSSSSSDHTADPDSDSSLSSAVSGLPAWRILRRRHSWSAAGVYQTLTSTPSSLSTSTSRSSSMTVINYHNSSLMWLIIWSGNKSLLSQHRQVARIRMTTVDITC